MSNKLGFNLIRFLARPITSVMEGGNVVAMLVGALLGGVAGGFGGMAVRWPMFLCALCGILVGSFLASLVFRRGPPPELAPDLPREPGPPLFEDGWSHGEILELTAAREHGLWSLRTGVPADLEECKAKLAAGAWPTEGTIVPWPTITKVEQHNLDVHATTVFYQRRDAANTVTFDHVSIESQHAFGESLQRQLGSGWQRRTAPEGLISVIFVPLGVLVVLATIGGVVETVVTFYPPPGPKEAENFHVFRVAFGGVSLGALLWAAYLGVGDRPKYVILEREGTPAD